MGPNIGVVVLLVRIGRSVVVEVFVVWVVVAVVAVAEVGEFGQSAKKN